MNVPEVTKACVNDAVSAALNRYFAIQTRGDTELQLTIERGSYDDVVRENLHALQRFVDRELRYMPGCQKMSSSCPMSQRRQTIWTGPRCSLET